MARQSEFKLGEIKEHTWGKNSGILKTNCSIIATNTLYCSSENPVKETKMTSRYEFSKVNIVRSTYRIHFLKDALLTGLSYKIRRYFRHSPVQYIK